MTDIYGHKKYHRRAGQTKEEYHKYPLKILVPILISTTIVIAEKKFRDNNRMLVWHKTTEIQFFSFASESTAFMKFPWDSCNQAG